MSKQTNKRIPVFRFPEFKKDGEWDEKKLGEITNVVSKRNNTNQKLPIYSINNKEGFLPQNEQFEGISSSDRGYDISLYKIIERNTFAYNPARIDVGSIGFSGELQNVMISSLYVCFQTIENIDDKFLWHFFNTFYFNKSVKSNVEGGIRNYLFYENFSKIKIFIPSLPEQQKIASCLSSLDEMIAAESQKLEALKTHKKGLMQNLFPQEGETVPKCRFSEFLEDGEWEEKKLGEICDRIQEKVGNSSLTTVSISAGIGFVTQSEKFSRDISGQQYKNYIVLKKGEFSYNKGSSKRFPQGCVYKLKEFEKVAVPNVFISFKFKTEYISDFFQGYFDNNFHGKQLQRYITSSARMDGLLNISAAVFFSTVFYIPKSKKEQQKIASCLSSLDELITAQAEKIEALKLHKKGLMQALFPNLNE